MKQLLLTLILLSTTVMASGGGYQEDYSYVNLSGGITLEPGTSINIGGLM
jgi:hypothetical protein